MVADLLDDCVNELFYNSSDCRCRPCVEVVIDPILDKYASKLAKYDPSSSIMGGGGTNLTHAYAP